MPSEVAEAHALRADLSYVGCARAPVDELDVEDRGHVTAARRRRQRLRLDALDALDRVPLQ